MQHFLIGKLAYSIVGRFGGNPRIIKYSVLLQCCKWIPAHHALPPEMAHTPMNQFKMIQTNVVVVCKRYSLAIVLSFQLNAITEWNSPSLGSFKNV
jgi:hypothetical protein